MAARGRSADLFKRTKGDGPADAATLTQHLDKLNALEAQWGDKEGAGGGEAEAEGEADEGVDAAHDEDDDDVMEEDDYYQVGLNGGPNWIGLGGAG